MLIDVTVSNVSAMYRSWPRNRLRYVHCLPRVVYPDIADSDGSNIPVLLQVLRQRSLLGLVLVVEHEDAEGGLLSSTSALLRCHLDVLLQLLDGILEGSAGVVNLVNNEHVLPNQVLHLQTAEVEPLGARDLGARLFDFVGSELFVEGETNRLNRDVRRARLLQEGSERLVGCDAMHICLHDLPENARGNITTTANGNDEVRLKLGENLWCCCLAQLVHLSSAC